MPRITRIVAPGFPHHVTQRGNRRAEIFFDRADRQKYLMLLAGCMDRYGVDLWAYCLMTNHVHLVVVPKEDSSLGRTIRDAHQAYSSHVNRKLRESGHLWQARFYSTVLDESHLWAAVRYVERNPVRAGLVARAQEYAWSSAPAHCGLRSDPLLSRAFPPEGVVDDWSSWLAGEQAEQTDAIRRCTMTGRPCGSMEFVERLEGLLGRILKLRKPGRKRKKPK